jgi:hypothetical protein
MSINTEKLSSGLRMLSLRDVQKVFLFPSLASVRQLLEALSIPIFDYPVVVPGSPVRIKEEKVLAMSLEIALFAHLLPGGSHLHVVDPEAESDPVSPFPEPPAAPVTVTNAVRELSGVLRCLDYWRLFQENPHALQLMVALAALMYGPYDEREVLNRLGALGDWILKDAVRMYTLNLGRRERKARAAARARTTESETTP